ncbi:hypothetical protein BDB00DRAFT_119510 [Zychaea mexicana]|uniref:uncharacterized protein n=1 Tax=Zychaea mexicana TaxID=64656 RepID=UPI0022FDDBFE|nr:uncharacterized protein BDB00DRAFT_119510 [Zychaea mexicana]KAI9496446.1 hypothetical protein BDB00DRAFT_119510 [Zychaea mexicana]
MPVPFEAFIPFGIIAAMFTVTGTGLGTVRYFANGHKPARFNVDVFDKAMMERDRRLTGSLRGQSTEPVAPAAFATNR